MAITLDTTLAGTNANSYCSVAYADDYFLNHYDAGKIAAWTALSDASKPMLLVQATRVLETARFTNVVTIDQYALYYDRRSGLVMQLDITREPVKSNWIQRLQFPRNLDRDFTTGVFYIPEGVLLAQCEQAVYLLTYDETALSNRLKGVVNDTVGLGGGDLHLNQEYAMDGTAFAPMALEYAKPFMLKAGAKYRRG